MTRGDVLAELQNLTGVNLNGAAAAVDGRAVFALLDGLANAGMSGDDLSVLFERASLPEKVEAAKVLALQTGTGMSDEHVGCVWCRTFRPVMGWGAA